MIKIRKASLADAAGIAYVHVSTWRTAYANIIANSYLSNLSIERSQLNMEQSLLNHENLIFVAEEDNCKIVAFVYGGESRSIADFPDYQAEVYAIYVLKDYEKRGLGRKLIQAIFQQFYLTGYHNVMLWTIKGNESEEFYQRINGRPLANRIHKIGEQEVLLTAYGFTEIYKSFDC